MYGGFFFFTFFIEGGMVFFREGGDCGKFLFLFFTFLLLIFVNLWF